MHTIAYPVGGVSSVHWTLPAGQVVNEGPCEPEGPCGPCDPDTVPTQFVGATPVGPVDPDVRTMLAYEAVATKMVEADG